MQVPSPLHSVFNVFLHAEPRQARSISSHGKTKIRCICKKYDAHPGYRSRRGGSLHRALNATASPAASTCCCVHFSHTGVGQNPSWLATRTSAECAGLRVLRWMKLYPHRPFIMYHHGLHGRSGCGVISAGLSNRSQRSLLAWPCCDTSRDAKQHIRINLWHAACSAPQIKASLSRLLLLAVFHGGGAVHGAGVEFSGEGGCAREAWRQSRNSSLGTSCHA